MFLKYTFLREIGSPGNSEKVELPFPLFIRKGFWVYAVKKAIV